MNDIAALFIRHNYMIKLNKQQKQVVEKYIYYLNIDELTKICTKYNIPIHIYYETNDGSKQSNYIIHKKDIIENILTFLDGKNPKKFLLKKNMVSFNNKKLKETDYVLFGQYKYSNVHQLLERLTNNYFKNGYASRAILYKLWKKNKLFTYKYYADYYIKNAHKYEGQEHKEWAWCNDMKNKETCPKNWKEYRNKISKKIIEILKLQL